MNRAGSGAVGSGARFAGLSCPKTCWHENNNMNSLNSEIIDTFMREVRPLLSRVVQLLY